MSPAAAAATATAATAAAERRAGAGGENARERLHPQFLGVRPLASVCRATGRVVSFGWLDASLRPPPSPQLAGGECLRAWRWHTQAKAKVPRDDPPHASAVPPCSTPAAVASGGPQGTASRLAVPWQCPTAAA